MPEPGRYGTGTGAADVVGEGGGTDDGAPAPEAEAPRRITRLDHSRDGVGYLRDRPSCLFVVDLGGVPGADHGSGGSSGPDGAVPDDPVRLTDRAVSVEDPAWTPDGRRLVVVVPRDGDRTETLHRDLGAVPADAAAPVLPEPVVRGAGDVARPVVSDDGTVYFYGTEFRGFAAVARNTGLWAATLPDPGTVATPRRLTDAETVDCARDAGPPAPYGDGVLVALLHRGAVELRSVPRDGDRVDLTGLTVLSGGRAAVRGFAVDGTRIAVVRAGPADTGEVTVLGSDGTETTPTDFSAPLRAAGVRPAEELSTHAPDGYPVHGWLVRPDGPGPHPVLLVVHGGPFAQYEWSLFDEAQVYASAGYAVVLGNPRGSAGYGQRHARAVLGRFGTVDADDLLALLDAALARPGTDADRVGVMGGSYGGFMTGWLAAHHGQRFRAAWSERAVNAWDSFTGSSDIGWWFADEYVGADPERQRAASPLTHADRITLPFAVVHSEQDLRCPIEQAQRMFVALRRNGTEAELLVFPGEGHELTRSGRPRHRVQRFEAVLDWWHRHLPVGEEPPAG